MNSLQLPLDAITSLDQLAQDLHLPTIDLLLIGDGSGTVYDKPAGWGCVAYDHRQQQVTLHAGALTTGTNNFAELMPYVQALWFHHQDHGQAPVTPVSVVIVSDSEVTVRCGNKRYARRANACVWSAISWFETNGYQLHWHHVRRNSNGWSAFMDNIAGQARQLLVANASPPQAQAGASTICIP
jgi:ribonuclease HI